MGFTFKHLKSDVLSGSVVFLIALPLCLGIALASGAPLFAGIISGVVGGIVIGLLSNSQLSVAGPAAGLTAIVLSAITTLGSYEVFLLAVVLAGAMQLVLGYAKAGTISNYFPSNVIEGMLTAIGIIIILKQIPHAFGYDADYEGDFSFQEPGTGHNSFTALLDTVNYLHLGAVMVTLVSLAILIAFNKVAYLKRLKALPGALVAVVAGTILNELFILSGSSLAIDQEHLVSLPMPATFDEFMGQFTLPDFTAFVNPQVWIVALTIAIVASVESLLCIEAADKIDPEKRFTNTNTELKAQGIGNMISGLIGGIPITSVIVRTSANINSGAKTKLSAVAHGVFLLTAVVAIPGLLNKIPLATLAAVLIMIGFKLASPAVFKHMWHSGKYQFIPFVVTVLAVVFTDLLVGVGIGLAVSIFFILKGNLKLAYFFNKEEHYQGETIRIDLAQEVSFLNKAAIKQTLIHLPEKSTVVIDASNTVYIDHDVLQLIKDFLERGSQEKQIKVNLTGFREAYKLHHYTHITSVPHASIDQRDTVEYHA
ncbi:SulP family inorganic anion transporter [Cesiribacter sp. SM1]|uniref:SulP family inorganic anion transporter n=1 Tax=Cesiribacter sp. SM1 TaxID=2861196 RepID=UPI001CD2B9A7|nr:SulP family inorganic anion transporter [Cesiribacter sp. SM1]